KTIGRAVDVAEITRHRFIPDAKVKDIQISTEQLTSEDGHTANVSSIEIFLTR
ncbi:MAG: RNA-binding protein, partial [Thermoplasmata archaeon]